MSNGLQSKFMVIPKDKLTANKFILLCLKKLEIGQVLDSCFQMSNSAELDFIELQYMRGRVHSYTDSMQKRVVVQYGSNGTNNKNEMLNNFSFRVDHYLDVTEELKEKYKPYVFSDKAVSSKSTSSFSFKVEDGQITDESLTDKINSKMWNLQFQEETIDSVYPFLCYIDSISHPKFVTDIDKVSINQYAKLKKWVNFLNNNPGLPKKENLNRIIRIILDNRDNLIGLNNLDTGFTAKSSLYSVDFIKGVNQIEVRLKLGPFNVFRDIKLERFKYMFHPGLYLFTRFLEVSDNIDHFELMMQKQIFKRI